MAGATPSFAHATITGQDTCEKWPVCGILGGVNTTFTSANLARLRHRGPDQEYFGSQIVPELGTVQLGQTRLNIVDRNDIGLPVRIGGATILFNGEIYNHAELRAELKRLDWTFETRTDIEVALAAYLQWGPDCLQRFNGMFALAVWDGRRFFCARDRLGQKPLFCRFAPDRSPAAESFEFASEIKAFNDLEPVQQDAFELFEFVFDEHTLFRDIFSIKPGHYLVYDPFRGSSYTRAYWDIQFQAGKRLTDGRRAVDELLGLLEDAVRLRMRAAVPITLFLSGGIDSSLIARLSGIEESFTCQFEEYRKTIDEERYVRDLARRLNINARFIRPKKAEFIRDLAKLGHYLEMPTGSFSVFPLYRLAGACRDAGYTVVLSGEGADELFAGYARSAFLLGEAQRADDDRSRHYAWMLERYHGTHLDRFCRMASRSGLIGASYLKTFLNAYWDDRRSPLENVCYIETKIFLQPLLQMSDRMCMAHSVEARCPFLDHRIVEFAFALDDSLRLRDGSGKWILHEAARKVLPGSSLVLDRTVKDGLPAPINLWMQGRHSFDRKYWNSLMLAECIKSLLSLTPEPTATEPSHPPTIAAELLRESPRTEFQDALR